MIEGGDENKRTVTDVECCSLRVEMEPMPWGTCKEILSLLPSGHWINADQVRSDWKLLTIWWVVSTPFSDDRCLFHKHNQQQGTKWMLLSFAVSVKHLKVELDAGTEPHEWHSGITTADQSLDHFWLAHSCSSYAKCLFSLPLDNGMGWDAQLLLEHFFLVVTRKVCCSLNPASFALHCMRW